MARTANESTATATASALHRFNRYEIKYFMKESQLPDLRKRIREYMVVDVNQAESSRRVTSLYYDTSDLRCYFEKIEGLRFRRKLRIRAYGEPDLINDDSTVFVEVKQRVNRVTQKRRIPLTYADARVLCDERRAPDDPTVRQAFVEEVLRMLTSIDLKPMAVTTYLREAYVGIDADLGLRVTLDHRVQGRDRDFHLGASAHNKFIIPQHLSVVEVKANERVPTWFVDLAAQLNLDVVRISKYCKSVEANSLGPRARLHARQAPGHE